MNLPFFFVDTLSDQTIVLEEDTSKHVIQVLRKKVGDQIMLTDGKGTKAIGEISDDHRKHCTVRIISTTRDAAKDHKVCIAISLVKNSSRFEWFLEKATEIGVTEIIPLLCERTEKEKFRLDRMQNIITSALLQSQQSWMPVLHEPTNFAEVLERTQYDQKYIAHCIGEEKQSLHNMIIEPVNAVILIGPEGDFTGEEVAQSFARGFLPVSLGDTRLRTETAGMVAGTLLCVR